jgi:hypothetical protein
LWTTSYLKEQRKLNKMGYFSCLGDNTLGIKNFKNLFRKNWVLGLLIKIVMLEFLYHKFYEPIL